MVDQVALDASMDAAWPSLERVDVDGWELRRSGGVTRRANSVLPVASPRDIPGALHRVEAFYAQAGLVPAFQISPAAQPADLDAVLAARGYGRRAVTLVQAAPTAHVLGRLPDHGTNISVTDSPGRGWVDLWWSIDGRGGPEERRLACDIMRGGPARYAAVSDEHGVTAVARLAHTGAWAGVACMAVRPDRRRQGQARAVLRALLVDTSAARLWLQVAIDNDAARRLYDSLGFEPASRYHYRIGPGTG